MVDEQLAARGITDPHVLDAMRKVPRHRFVAEKYAEHAYRDGPLPIGCSQTISQPYMVAVMTQLLAVQPTDRVLEIGTGSGYQAAVLSQIAREIVTIERHAELATFARRNIENLGITNVTVLTGDGTQGYSERAPYDGIIVTAGAPAVPQALLDQLADGGRLVCPAGSRQEQTLRVVRRTGGQFTVQETVPCMFVPLIGREGWEE
jgi:protein-L-isoaspartate(D-aspartate) O-methyltransferase